MSSIFDIIPSETLSPIALPLPERTSRHIVSNGTRGTEQTIAMMQKLVNSGKRNNKIRRLCGEIISKCRSKDYYCYAKSAYEWVRDHIKYAYDPNLVEYLEGADVVLANKIGDCDSMDILLASMFENLGFQTQFVTIKADDSRPDEFTHVYLRTLIPKVGWVNADPIMPDKYFGWEAPYPNGRRYWHSCSDELSMPLDTTPSTEAPMGGGMMGLADHVDGMGHGGGHHHGGGRWRGGGYGGGWGYGPYWGGGFDDNVYVLPLVVGTTAQLDVVPNENVLMQQLESPVMETTSGMKGLGLATLGADVQFGVTGKSLSEGGTLDWVKSIVSGDFANKYNAAKKKNQDTLTALLTQKRAAQAKNNARLVALIQKAEASAIDESQKLSAVKTYYNAAVNEIKIQTYGGISPKGLGIEPLTAITIGIVSASLAFTVYQLSQAWAQASAAQVTVSNNMFEILKDPSATPEAKNAASSILSGSGISGSIGSSVLTVGGIAAGAWIVAKLVGHYFGKSA